MSALPPNYPPGSYPPPGMPGMPPYYGGLPQQPPSNTPATLSLVLGCLTLLFSALAGIPAIILGFIGLKKASEPGLERTKGMAIAGIIVAIVIMVLHAGMLSVLIPAITRARTQADAVRSMSNLRQIAQSLTMYEMENNGYFPPDLTALANAYPGIVQYRHPSNSAPPPVPSNVPDDGDYVYVYAGYKNNLTGKPLRSRDIRQSARVIILHERPQFANRGLISVAFADGHTERIPVGELQSRLAKQDPPPPSAR